MNKLIGIFLLNILICSCTATDQNVNDFLLEKVSTVKIDESNVVLKTLPNTSVMLGKDHIISSVDYTTFVVYNLQNGTVENHFSIDSVMRNSNFDLLQYEKDNCEKVFADRQYLSSEADKSMVPFKIFKFPAKVNSLDSVVTLIGIFTPYSASMLYNGENIKAIYSGYSFAIATIDFNTKKLKHLYPIRDYLLKRKEDSTQTIFPYIETGTLVDKGKIWLTVLPSAADNPNLKNELVTMSLDSSDLVTVCPTLYPKNLADFSNSILCLNLQKDKSGDVFYNSIYDIYKVSQVDKPEKVLSLQGLLNASKKERINSFCKINEDLFLIQALSNDSLSGSINFRLYNTKTKQLGHSLMTYNVTAELEYVLYTEDGFIKFTAKDENYYFEKYLLKNRASNTD
jgi:hypothetical protein